MKIILLVIFVMTLFPKVQAQTSKEANYDEAKVPDYILPDVLKTTAGKPVKTKADWEKTRRSEILNLFEDNVYGQMPGKFDNIRYAVIKQYDTAMNGRARMKEVLIEVTNKGKSVKINLLLFIPKQAKRPVPVFLLINNRPLQNTDPTRAVKSEFWPAELVVDSGYAIAAIHYSDMAPDNKDTYANGVLQLYPEQLTADNGMKAVGAWAWGASRVMDYLETDKEIDAAKVAVVGHSRGGKASLWAAAQDKRFAICVTNCSGNTGAALARRQYGERIERINTSFPHWFSNNYKKFNNNESALPVDQHMLIAMIAPRPVYATNASKDLWADPTGTFLALKHAEKVFELYGKKSGLPALPPAINKSIVQPPIGYHNREGIHDLTAFDWSHFIQFANRYYKNL